MCNECMLTIHHHFLCWLNFDTTYVLVFVYPYCTRGTHDHDYYYYVCCVGHCSSSRSLVVVITFYYLSLTPRFSQIKCVLLLLYVLLVIVFVISYSRLACRDVLQLKLYHIKTLIKRQPIHRTLTKVL